MASCTAPHGRDHLTNFGDQEPRKEGLGALDGYQDQKEAAAFREKGACLSLSLSLSANPILFPF